MSGIIEASKEREKNRMMQLGFFNEETRFEKLTKLGDSLEKLNMIDWKIFHPYCMLLSGKNAKVPAVFLCMTTFFCSKP